MPLASEKPTGVVGPASFSFRRWRSEAISQPCWGPGEARALFCPWRTGVRKYPAAADGLQGWQEPGARSCRGHGGTSQQACRVWLLRPWEVAGKQKLVPEEVVIPRGTKMARLPWWRHERKTRRGRKNQSTDWFGWILGLVRLQGRKDTLPTRVLWISTSCKFVEG